MSALESKESSEAQGSGDDLTSQLSSNQIEKLEEAKLMAKYPLAGGGHSSFLQKRLNKNQKYFDSGDYQMAKQTTLTGPNKMLPQSTYNTGFVATGDEIPTPETVPMRKTSIIQSKFHPPSMSLPLS